MFRTLAEFSELMSMALIQKSPLRMSLASISTLRIQAQKGCIALSICKAAAATGLAPRKHAADVPTVYWVQKYLWALLRGLLGSDLKMEVHKEVLGCGKGPTFFSILHRRRVLQGI